MAVPPQSEASASEVVETSHACGTTRLLNETNFYAANKPSNQLVPLSPLFSSTNNPIDIKSVQVKIQEGPDGWSNYFNNSHTNAPTITIGSTSRPIGNLFMNDADVDEIGIRITPPNLVFTNGQTSRWIDSGILNKPIGDFLSSSDRLVLENPIFASGYMQWADSREGFPRPYFNSEGTYINIHSRAIPEPEEYALVFGLFALGFVFFRHFQKKTIKGGRTA